MAQTDRYVYLYSICTVRERREVLEAGWPVVFAVSGAAEVAVVVSVGRPPSRAVGHCEGD